MKKLKYIILIVLSIIAIIVGFVLGQKPKVIERKNAPSVQQVNILDIKDKSASNINGLTYSINNGVITINGTATSGGGITVNLSQSIPSGSVVSYKTFMEGSTSSNWGYTLRYSNYENVNNQGGDYSNFTLTGDVNMWFMAFASGFTYNDFKIKPMLVYGPYLPNNFESYKSTERDYLSGVIFDYLEPYQQLVDFNILDPENLSPIITSDYIYIEAKNISYDSHRFDLKVDNTNNYITSEFLNYDNIIVYTLLNENNNIRMSIYSLDITFNGNVNYNYNFIYERVYQYNGEPIIFQQSNNNIMLFDYVMNNNDWQNLIEPSDFEKTLYNQLFWGGYDNGYSTAESVAPETNVITLFGAMGQGLAQVLNIEILPHLTIGVICSIPLVFGIILLILKLVRGG